MKLLHFKTAASRPMIFILCGIILSIECGAESPLTYSEVVKETAQLLDKNMEEYEGPPAISRPDTKFRSPEALAWSRKVQDVRLAALERMDNAVLNMIENGIERGLSLNDIQARTASRVTWVEWPMEYNNLNGEPRGISDRRLTEEEWASSANAVAVIHQSYKTRNGLDLHYLQCTFRNRLGKDGGERLSFSAYVVVLDAGKVRRERLFLSLSALTLDGHPQKLLGFVDRPDGDIPDILMYRGPFASGPWIELAYYIWFERIDGWKESIGSEDPIRPAESVAFDPKSAELRFGFSKTTTGSVRDLNGALDAVREYIEENSNK